MDYKLKFDTASIVEITPEYIGVLMDGSVHFNIGLTNKDTELDIKKHILSHASNEENTGTYIVPFSKVEEIPKNIRDIFSSTIDLKELKQEVLIEEEKRSTLTEILCAEAREEILPTFDQFFESLYQKEIKNDSDKYNQLLERIKLAFELFPIELGERITVEKYEEIISGL